MESTSKRSILFQVAGAGVIIFSIVLLSLTQQGKAPSFGGNTQTPTPTTALQSHYDIRITSTGISPNYVHIKTGGSVKWINEDIVSHSLIGLGIDTGPIVPGGQYTISFSESSDRIYTSKESPTFVGQIFISDN